MDTEITRRHCVSGGVHFLRDVLGHDVVASSICECRFCQYVSFSVFSQPFFLRAESWTNAGLVEAR
jgi:hypothetical protein